MSIFIGSNVGETIEPGSVSSTVAVIGNPKAPSAAADLIFAGSGNDRVAGGGGSDIVFLGAGDDLFTWNSGDGSDLVDGGSGIDTLAFNGSAAAETIRLSTGILGTLHVSDNVENINMTLTGMERVVIRAGLGNDVVDASALPAGQATLEIFGGDGNDLLIGSAGNDTFVWNPGDDNDTIEGRAGLDTLQFNGANIGESINVLANGTRVLFTRDIANVTMDLNQVERIEFNALGGADKVTVNDLSGTGVTEVDVNLAGTPGGTAGDGAIDQVIVNGTAGDDTIQAAANGTSATVLGLAAVTNVSNLESIDQLIVDGQGGNDTLIGGAGSQILHGGDGDDVLRGGDGDDQMFGDAGNDRMVWNPGDDTDLMEGGADVDTAEVNGGNAAELFTATANGTRVRFDRVDPGPFSLDIGSTEEVVVNMNGGNDQFSATGNLSPLIHITVDGGLGDDTILGSNGNDTLFGGEGNDFIDGNQGSDTAIMGAGEDTFQWDPGDGSDTVEGGDGADRMLFNGSNIGEEISASANGERALSTRNIGNIAMDLNDVERIEFNALGGADKVTVNDLSGTDVTEVDVNLAGTFGGATGDGTADQVIVNGTSGNDTIQAAANGTSATVLGLAAVTNVSNLETIDQLVVDGQGGNDTLIGGAGSQVLRGGEGNDVLRGGDGDDQMFGDAGNDRMVWNPGDDTDLMEGGDDVDTAEVNAGNGAEVFTVTANGTRVRFDRLEPAPFSLDIGTTEELVVNMNGGDDRFSASGNLSPLIHITVDGGLGDDTILGSNGNDTLFGGEGNDFIDGNQGADSAFMGAGEDTFQWDPGDGNDTVEGGDGFDTLLFNGSNIGEEINVSANGERALFTRNIANITMDLNDVERIEFNALGGADSVKVHDLSGTDVVEVNIDLGATGGGGDGAIDRVVVEGTGGDDVIEVVDSGTSIIVSGLPALVHIDNAEAQDVLAIDAGDGDDTLLFSGTNIAENVDIAANGERATIFRNTGNVALDLGGAESIHFRALDGIDSIVVGDLSGTTVQQVDIDLAGSGDGNAPDGSVDSVAINGTNGADAISVVGLADDVAVTGLQAEVSIENAGAQDRLVINALGGDDVVDASGLAANQVQLTINGGLGQDIMIGSAGADQFNGGDGNDLAFMGGGDDSFVWNPGDDNDTLEGQAGFDTLHFNGANIAETVDLFANGGRAALTRDIANITMDADDVERFDFNALGGADKVTVHDLSGTDAVEVNLNLAATLGGSTGDGAADQVTVDATDGDDVVVIAGDAGGVSVLGLSAQVNVTGADAGDRLQVHAGDGDDVIQASGVAAGSIGLVLDGGKGDDVIIGGAGDDVLIGGEGDDVLIGGGGNDVFDFGPGNDVVIQDFASGEDKLDLRGFAGANDLDWVLAHARDAGGGDTVLDLGDGGEVTLTHVDVAALQIDDFLF